jgi:hypothetical protein
MALRFTGNCLYIDLDVTSMILNHCGIKGYLTYLSFVTYKKHNGDTYTTPEGLNECSLLESIKDYSTPLKKLQEIGLIVKRGKQYTATTKNKRWLTFANKSYKDSLGLGGTLVLSMDEFYTLKKCPIKNVEERMYLTLTNAVRKGNSLSRKFMKLITGVSPKRQASIEKKYEGVNSGDVFFPINAEERDKIDSMPFMKGRFDSNSIIAKSEGKQNNCTVAQMGNSLAIHPSLCHGFLQRKVAREKRESLSLNEPVQRGEVCDWDSFYATIDLSTEELDRTKKAFDFYNVKDKRQKTWDRLKKNPYSAVNVITKKGEIVNLRDFLRRFSF